VLGNDYAFLIGSWDWEGAAILTCEIVRGKREKACERRKKITKEGEGV